MTDDPTNPRPDDSASVPEEPPASSGPASNENIQPPEAESSFPPGYPDMRSNTAKGLSRPAMHTGPRISYNISPIAYEYDLYDWAWRIGFGVLGLILGFLIGHFL